MSADLVPLPATEAVLDKLDLYLDFDLVLVQHLRHDTLSFIDLLSDRCPSIRLIAIPYSIDPASVNSVSTLRLDVEYPTLPDIPRTIFRVLEGSKRGVLVQDVGGHLADVLAWASPPSLKAAVEETKQGLWRYGALPEIGVPIVQIADSQLKQIEARYVGTAVACSLVEQLRTLGVSFIGRRVGVLGYGDIGSATARALRGLGALVAVTDASSVQMILAEADGFAVLSRRGLLDSSVAIVACTGGRSLEPSDLEATGDGVVFASGTSRQIEFERVLDRFEVAFELPTGMRPSKVLHAISSPEVLLLNEGYPINFLGESLPRSIIDLVFAQLSVALARVGGLAPGLHGLSSGDLETVASGWLDAYPHYRPFSSELE